MKDDGLGAPLTVTGLDNEGGESAISYFFRRLGVFDPDDLMCCLGVPQLLPAPLLLLPPLLPPLLVAVLNTGE